LSPPARQQPTGGQAPNFSSSAYSHVRTPPESFKISRPMREASRTRRRLLTDLGAFP
jgi:hypothetical protein